MNQVSLSHWLKGKPKIQFSLRLGYWHWRYPRLIADDEASGTHYGRRRSMTLKIESHITTACLGENIRLYHTVELGSCRHSSYLRERTRALALVKSKVNAPSKQFTEPDIWRTLLLWSVLEIAFFLILEWVWWREMGAGSRFARRTVLVLLIFKTCSDFSRN